MSIVRAPLSPTTLRRRCTPDGQISAIVAVDFRALLAAMDARHTSEAFSNLLSQTLTGSPDTLTNFTWTLVGVDPPTTLLVAVTGTVPFDF